MNQYKNLPGGNGGQRKKIHPYKFTLWVGIGSIIMMFAGFTSAYIVKREQPGWIGFSMPVIFWYSTAVMVLSSIVMQVALSAFKNRDMGKYRNLIGATTGLGILFVIMQVIGYWQLNKLGVKVEGSGGGVFFIIIFGLHALHVLGGIIALMVLFFRTVSNRVRNYNAVPVEVAATYWHFVDVLWVYLFVFFLIIQ
ncbi:MAG TPA: cytochrome c oxidase subunit 3 [Chitinophagaceae bacterium]|nr:cytochrome c oxidase subunit 3 [Chitinophagaceae bacterium]